jgi:hypothetical protein
MGVQPTNAAELITRRSCQADGGTFAVVNGYRQCTKVITYDESLGITRNQATAEDGVVYVGEVEDFITIRFTTVTRQRGSETPTTTGADEILADWTEQRCYRYEGANLVSAPEGECASLSLFDR